MTNVSSPAIPAVSAGGYDRFGVPTSDIAAFAMSRDQIREAVLKVVAFNDGCDVTDLPSVLSAADDGSLALDSVQAVYAAASFSTGFGTGDKLVKLSKINQKNWASTESVTNLLVNLIAGRKASK